MLSEALDRYPTIEGVHLDYIRDPGLGGCFSEACLARFHAATEIVLPPSLLNAAARAEYIQRFHHDAYVAWRAEEITSLVRRIRELVDRQRPGLTLAVDVFPNPDWAYRGVFQDWRRWASEGLVDAVYPMFYAEARELWSVDQYVRDVIGELDRRASAAGRQRAKVVLGVSTAWYEPLPPEHAEDLITSALANGADGIALQSLAYWWHEEYRQFRRSYLPRSESWAPLWDYDPALARLFRKT
jgi:hypothetical protein